MIVSQISIFIVQSGPIKNSLVAFSTRTAADDDDDEDEEEVAPNDEIIFFLKKLQKKKKKTFTAKSLLRFVNFLGKYLNCIFSEKN